MTEDMLATILSTLGELKASLQKQPGFLKSTNLKGCYVIFTAVEAAVMNNAVHDFALNCADFVSQKAIEQEENAHFSVPFRVVGS